MDPNAVNLRFSTDSNNNDTSDLLIELLDSNATVIDSFFCGDDD